MTRQATAAADASAELELTLPACFEQNAFRHARRPALVGGTWQPSYEELNATANRCAEELLDRPGTRGDRVALLMRHDSPLIAAVAGVLKAGRVVVVLNPTDPPARLEQVLADADAGFVMTDGALRPLADRIAGSQRTVIPFVAEHTSASTPNPQVPVAPDDLAFLVYTSGSTGRPKGVMQTHRNIRHHVHRLTCGLGLGPEDRIALLASLSGGQGVGTTWCALLNGAALCPFPLVERGLSGLADSIEERRISVYVSAASVFRHFTKTLPPGRQFPGVRIVRLASEAATAEDFAAYRRHFTSSSTLFHTLSSSETGNITQMRFNWNDRVPAGRLPIGWPALGMDVRLLDESGQEVPDGQAGELVVQSRYLSPGYWRNPSLTAERFVPAAAPGQPRSFRSGDLACRDADGRLVFVGRKDARLKVRGYRIEPAEVEDALMRVPTIDEAAVSLRPLDADAQLVAYVTLRPGQCSTAEDLRLAALRAALPVHMVPTSFVFLDHLPLTPHGKIDREALRQLPPPTHQATGEKPATSSERVLAEIWQEVFRTPSIGRDDNFFDLGGDSLRALVVAARVHAVMGIALEMREFTDRPKLAALAAVIDERRCEATAADGVPLVCADRGSPLPLSFAQERAWRFSQTPEASAGYTVACCYRIRGSLEVTALRESMDAIARRHEILRTTFSPAADNPGQIVHPAALVSLPLIDLTTAPDPEEQARQFFRSQARIPFDLTRLPLLRFHLLRIRPEEYWLLRVSHHIISDNWSWAVYFQELSLLYEARIRGGSQPLPEFEPLQYGDYAAWQRQVLDPQGPAFRAEIDWWATQFTKRAQAQHLPFQRRKCLPDAPVEAGVLGYAIDPAITVRLNRIGREMEATYYVVRLAAFVALLAAETGRPEVVLGTYVSNRSRVEVQRMLGLFVNMATIRLPCRLKTSFREWVRYVRAIIGETQAHSAIPYEQLCEELRRKRVLPPEIRLIFGVSDRTAAVRLGDAELTWLDRRTETMPWGFSLMLDQFEGQERCRVSFDARLYDPRGVQELMARFGRFLDVAGTHPDSTLRELIGMLDNGLDERGAAA